MLPELFTSAYE